MSETAENPNVDAPRRGGASGVLALLLALIALGLSGYLAYREMYRDPLASVLPTLEALQAAQARIPADVTRQIEARFADPELALARQLATQEVRLAATQQEISHLRGLIAVSDIDPRPWRLAEASHLLRLANDSLRFGGDVPAALAAVRAARGLVAGLDDADLAPAVAALDRDINALESAPVVDVDGIVLRLEAAKATLPELPVKLPNYDVPSSEPEQPTDGWQTALDRLSALFKFRAEGSASPRPLLEPAEHRYLELNLALALERAQLALLRGDARLFEQTLAGFATALDEFYDGADSRVAALANEIAALRALDIVPSLPVLNTDLYITSAAPASTPALPDVPAAQSTPALDAPDAEPTGSDAAAPAGDEQ
jgi:uroporphyrin-3 C-methyltransferase